jgi:formamidase
MEMNDLWVALPSCLISTLPACSRGGIVRSPCAAMCGSSGTADSVDAGRWRSSGARLLIPVDTPGALFSAGDAHFAQGDLWHGH